jgi:myosin heavy subunit
MTVLGITPDIQEDMFRVIGAILKNGNALFKSDGKEGAVVQNPEGIVIVNAQLVTC